MSTGVKQGVVTPTGTFVRALTSYASPNRDPIPLQLHSLSNCHTQQPTRECFTNLNHYLKIRGSPANNIAPPIGPRSHTHLALANDHSSNCSYIRKARQWPIHELRLVDVTWSPTIAILPACMPLNILRTCERLLMEGQCNYWKE